MGAGLYYFLCTRCQRYGIDAVRSALARPDPVPPVERARALCLVGIAWASALGWDSQTERREAQEWIGQGLFARGRPWSGFAAWAFATSPYLV
jgi:hypothetical protein